MTKVTDYQRGYAAGRKKAGNEMEELRLLRLAIDEKKERIYMS